MNQNTYLRNSLEVQDYEPEKFHRVLQLGSVESLIFNDSLWGLQFDGPHYQVVKLSHINQLVRPQCDHFKGYILRATDREMLNFSIESLQHIQLLEISVTQVSISLKLFERLNSYKQFIIILRCINGLSLGVMNQTLQVIQTKNYDKLNFIKHPYDLPHSGFDDWISLEDFQAPIFQQNVQNESKLSVVIPHYESPHFVCNVLWHLSRVIESDKLDVILVDDGSSQKTLQYIQYFSHKNASHLPLRLFCWPDSPTLLGAKKIFRAGASRNWGAAYAQSENLLFLDADMLVPENLISLIEQRLIVKDVVQFERWHIPVSQSHESSLYQDLVGDPRLYIEEEAYWGKLFSTLNWMELDHHWKYVCTYALAMKKSTFNQVGRIRRNYIQYGFEDTDLGYRLAKRDLSFHLEKTPMLHLTPREQDAQSWTFKLQKMNRIRDMACVFFSLNQDPIIYKTLRSLLS